MRFNKNPIHWKQLTKKQKPYTENILPSIRGIHYFQRKETII